MPNKLEVFKQKSLEILSAISRTNELVETLIDRTNEGLEIISSTNGTALDGKIFRIGVTMINEKGIVAPIKVIKKDALRNMMFIDTFYLMPLKMTTLEPLIASMEGDYINDMEQHLQSELAKGRMSLSSQLCLREKILSNMRIPYKTSRGKGFVFFSGDRKGMFNDEILDFATSLIKTFESALDTCNDLDALVKTISASIGDLGSVPENVELMRTMQKKLEPDDSAVNEKHPLEIYHRCFPWEGHPSGDLLNIWDIDRNRIGILLADVTGHGLESALITIYLRGLFLRETAMNLDPAGVMNSIHQKLRTYIDENMANPYMYSATTIYGHLDLAEGSFTYCNAGHNPQFRIFRENGALSHEFMQPTSMPLGMPFDETYEAHTLPVKEGDLLVFYTDGITEARNKDFLQFGRDNLLDCVTAGFEKPLETIGKEVLDKIDIHTGGTPAEDDVTFMLIRIGKIDAPD